MSAAGKTPSPPVMIRQDVERIKAVFPQEMLELRQWVAYRMIWSEEKGKFDKIPLNPNTGRNARTNDPDTWGSFNHSVKRALNRKLGGVGFVFSRDDEYVGIDIDHCTDENGEISPEARALVEELNTYTEKSPSGTGLHLIGRGALPPRGRHTENIEMYDTGRFFTVTGQVAGPGALRNFQAELNAVHLRLFPRKTPKPRKADHDRDDFATVALTKDEIIEIATRASNGAKFDALWRGDWKGQNYPSQSEADQALCDILAFYVNYDGLRVDYLFRESGLFRPEKWDTAHSADGRTYGQLTVAKATEGHSNRDGYHPSAKKRRPKVSPADPGRPTISTNRQLIKVLEDAWALTHDVNQRSGGPRVFVRSGQLVRIRHDITPPCIAAMPREAMSGFLFRHADWVIWSEEFMRPTRPHPEVVASMLCDPDPALPALEMVAHAPFFTPEGGLIAKDGYYPKVRTWLKLSDDLQNIEIPGNPTDSDIHLALSLFLDDLLVDFPFSDQSDRANCLGAFILPFVRPLISDVTPLHLFEAPTPGSGKGLLANLLCLLSSGQEAVVQVFPYEEEELRKRLSSELLKGRPVIIFDNADSRRQLDSPTLAAALTTTIWGDRELGKIADVTLPNNSIWVMTANNLSLSSELADRTVRIRIDPRTERPRERDPRGFKHHPLKKWMRQNRREFVTAALTLTQAWILAGSPFSGREYGSFESWSRVIGGILEHAGVTGFMGNRAEFFEQADADLKMWHDFVNAWWERFGDRAVQVKQLNDLCEEQELMLPVRRDGNERSQVTKLGNALKRARDGVKGKFRIHTDVYVVNASGSHRNNGYRIMRVENEDGASSPHISDELHFASADNDFHSLEAAEAIEEAPF